MRVRGHGIVLVHVVVLHLVGPKILSSVVAMLGSILILRYHVVAVLTMVDPIMGRPAAGNIEVVSGSRGSMRRAH